MLLISNHITQRKTLNKFLFIKIPIRKTKIIYAFFFSTLLSKYLWLIFFLILKRNYFLGINSEEKVYKKGRIIFTKLCFYTFFKLFIFFNHIANGKWINFIFYFKKYIQLFLSEYFHSAYNFILAEFICYRNFHISLFIF